MKQKFFLRDRQYLILFLLPSIIVLMIFTIFPLIYSLRISFTDWDLIKEGSINNFIGFRNYIELFKSSGFWSSLLVSAQLTIGGVTGSMIIGTALGFLLYQKLRGTSIIRTLIISAMIMTPVVVGITWRLMYNADWGIINYLLDVVGIGGKAWLAQSSTVIGAIIVTDIWQWSPLVMIIVLAGLQGLPDEIYEAAKVDGASHWHAFWYITIPLLKPVLVLALLIRLMDSFRIFDIIYVMTAGGPGNASQNLNVLMYNIGFEFFKISKAAALAIISVIIVTVISSYLIKIIKRKDDTGLW